MDGSTSAALWDAAGAGVQGYSGCPYPGCTLAQSPGCARPSSRRAVCPPVATLSFSLRLSPLPLDIGQAHAHALQLVCTEARRFAL